MPIRHSTPGAPENNTRQGVLQSVYLGSHLRAAILTLASSADKNHGLTTSTSRSCLGTLLTIARPTASLKRGGVVKQSLALHGPLQLRQFPLGVDVLLR